MLLNSGVIVYIFSKKITNNGILPDARIEIWSNFVTVNEIFLPSLSVVQGFQMLLD
jgi:hypothetical protein